MKKGWEMKKLGDVCEKISRGISPKYIENNGIIVLNQKCIRDHKINFELSRKHDYVNKSVNAEKHIRIGDVLVNSTGEGTLGRVAQVRDLPNQRITVDSHISIVRPLKDKFFLDYFGWAMIFIENEIEESGAGASGQTELARTVLENNFTLVYPKSLPEQKRIVSILEEAFAAINKAKANAEQNLKNAKELFESYLQEVFENRKLNWKEGKLLELASSITDGDHMPPPKAASGIPFITISNIGKRNNQIDFSDTFSVSLNYYQKLKDNRKPKRGDILYTVTGSYGIPVLIESDIEFCFQRHIGLIRPNENTNSKWLFYWILSPQAIKQAHDTATGAAQKTVSLKALRNFVVPVMSTDQQETIVHKLDALSTETKKLETIYKQKINDLEELKKSVLQKAFSGEL